MSPDERKAHFRQGLSSLYIPFYDKLCVALSSWNVGQEHPELAGFSWAPYDAVRTFQEQDNDYAQGRSRPGGVITNARGGESPHQYGCANDWTLVDAHGNVTWLKKSHPIWAKFQAVVEGVGLRSGAHFNDPDHSELKIDCDWKHVLIAFKQTNMTGAQQYIEARMVKSA